MYCRVEDKASAFAEASRGVWLKRTAEGREQLDTARQTLVRQLTTALTALKDCHTTADAQTLIHRAVHAEQAHPCVGSLCWVRVAKMLKISEAA